MPKSEFAVHGLEAEVLDSKVATIKMRSAVAGTVITQQKGTGNWIHFAMPSPKYINDKPMKIVKIWLRYSINDNAVIDAISIHDESVSVYESQLHLVGRKNELLEKSISPHQISSGIVISVHVGFTDDGGEVNFVGAGMQMDE
jgi:hypothetical protein